MPGKLIIERLLFDANKTNIKIIPLLSSCTKSLMIFFYEPIDIIIDSKIYNFSASITEELDIRIYKKDQIASILLIKLLEIFLT